MYSANIVAEIGADVDEAATALVLRAYNNAKASELWPEAKFEAALDAYCEAHPEISRPDARHVIAHILAGGKQASSLERQGHDLKDRGGSLIDFGLGIDPPVF